MASIPIGTVENVIRRAMKNGSATGAPYAAEWDGHTLTLNHYGTVIFRGTHQGVIMTGGWSVSDRQAIQTAMHVLGINNAITGSANVAKHFGMKQIGSKGFFGDW